MLNEKFVKVFARITGLGTITKNSREEVQAFYKAVGDRWDELLSHLLEGFAPVNRRGAGLIRLLSNMLCR